MTCADAGGCIVLLHIWIFRVFFSPDDDRFFFVFWQLDIPVCRCCSHIAAAQGECIRWESTLQVYSKPCRAGVKSAIPIGHPTEALYALKPKAWAKSFTCAFKNIVYIAKKPKSQTQPQSWTIKIEVISWLPAPGKWIPVYVIYI